MIGLEHFLVLSALLFSIGLWGALVKRNIVTILMCIEIMFNGVNIAFVAFSRYNTPTLLTGQVFALFVIAVAAAEITLGLAIVIAVFRTRETVDVSEMGLMKG
ncbi:MAG: NADH-quinone oxidoreductase subunit NuoK [Chloroflexi bacterium]|nr:NADH-quinone oxidoreductase subunit NuoK [Chloroflexota bacterium]MCH8086722.1 NADH-quinone oxidoreductase subunit NuoK [Chloroflexota bacterium]